MQQSRLHRFLGIDSSLGIAITVVALAMVVYQLIGVFLRPLEPVWHANTHLLFVLLMVLLPGLQSATKTRWKFAIIVTIVLGLVGVGYMYANSERLQWFEGRLNTTDIVIGVILVALIFELSRRATGIILPLIGLLFMAYAFLGHYVPRPFGHFPTSLSQVITWSCMSATDGIYGSLIFISANIVFLFIMFGTMLEITKAREFFTLVGLWVGRKLRGGTGIAATVSSGLVGMITGSGAANAIITGVVTIPLMKRAGFKSQVAAAVEATASSGGLFMPPVMGAVAFMMMSITGFTYLSIITAAAIPAVIYYLSIALAVFFFSGRHNVPRVKEEVDMKLLWRRAPLFIIPFGVITGLLALRYSPMYASGWALVLGMFLGFISKETRPSLKNFLAAVTQGAKTASEIATMLIICNMAIVSMIGLTAMAPKFNILIYMAGGGVVFGMLIVTMFVSLLLGMVNPIAGSYLIVALITTPALTAMGLSVMQAHFFALFMGTLAFFTPPVAPTAIITSRIAGVPFLGTCVEALKLVAGAFILPFLFAFDAALLGDFSAGLLSAGLSIGLALLVMVVTSIMMQRYYLTGLSWPEVPLGLASLVALVMYFVAGHNILVVALGVALFALLTLSQIVRRRRGVRIAENMLTS